MIHYLLRISVIIITERVGFEPTVLLTRQFSRLMQSTTLPPFLSDFKVQPLHFTLSPLFLIQKFFTGEDTINLVFSVI